MIGETLAHYKSLRKSAPVAWARSTGPPTPSSTATSPSRSSLPATPTTPSAWPASSARRTCWPRSATARSPPCMAWRTSNGSKALVMELVEGVDLSDRLKQGPLPLTEALRTASQIAEALEAAHEHGIIHRDLKPANIKLLPDGRIKLLDFGLAKALEAASAEALADSATLSGGATRAGIVMGTAAYMSPEQATGAPVDKRTDVWAFGVVLFEMLTGQRLFEGETTSHTLAEVIRAEIDFNRLPPTTPPEVRGLLGTVPRSRAASPVARHPRGAAADRSPARAWQRIQHSGAHATPPQPLRHQCRLVSLAWASAWRGRRSAVAAGAAWLLWPKASPFQQLRVEVRLTDPGAQQRSRDPRSISRPAGRASRLSSAAKASASCAYGNSTSWTARFSRFATTTASPIIRFSRPMASGWDLSPRPRCGKCRRQAARR